MSLPRLVTSRSHEKLCYDSRLTSKQSVKLALVERAIYNIGRELECGRLIGTLPAKSVKVST
jgi:hypothetical protein